MIPTGYRIGDALEILRDIDDGAFDCCVTSPPYWGLRDYGVEGQLGLEATPEEYTEKMVEIFGEVRRTLKDDGSLWLNLGDSYAQANARGGTSNSDHKADGNKGFRSSARYTESATMSAKSCGLKPKDLVGIPWRIAFALQADGWYLRSDIIWSKPNPMPESVTDRPTKAHEYIFLMSKQAKYFYDGDAVKEPVSESFIERWGSADPPKKNPSPQGLNVDSIKGESCMGTSGGKRNRRSVWTVTTQPYPDAHFATYPPDLIKPCILAGCPPGGIVLDPFFGSGTTGQVCESLGRRWFGIELNPDYEPLIKKRTAQIGLSL